MPSSNTSKTEKNYKDRFYCFICNISREKHCKEWLLIPFTMIHDHHVANVSCKS